MDGSFTRRTGAAVAATIAVVASTAPAAAQSVADFYKANKVTILVGADAGGGYDTYARLLARHISRHIPGEPTVIVQNMPSFASINSVNHLANISPRDGSVIGAVQREVAMMEVVGTAGVKFKARDLIWLGSLLSEPGVCGAMATSGITPFGEVFSKELIVGSTGPNAIEQYPAMFNNLLGAKFKIVKGYKSAAAVGLAMERGELGGICQSWATFKQQNAKVLGDGTLKPLVQVALKPVPEMTARGVPMFTDFVTDARLPKGMTRQDVLDTFEFQLSSSVMGRPYVLAQGVPADRAAAIMKAVEDVVKDPEFLADAGKMKRDIDFVSGQEITEIINRMASLPKAKLDRMEDALKTD